MLRTVDPRRVLLALLLAPLFADCDALPAMFLEELDEAAVSQMAVDEDDWGPFKLGMSLKEAKAIIKARTGQEPVVERLPGLKWDTIVFQDKMLTFQNGVLLCVHRSEHAQRGLRLGQDHERENEGDPLVEQEDDE